MFNGQGLTSPNDFDSYKDFIGQIVWKPAFISKNLYASGGVSLLAVALAQFTNVTYRIGDKAGKKEIDDNI